jgi:hypothetical protein
MFIRRLAMSVAALAAVALTTSAARADIEIDTFNQPDPVVQYAIGPDPNPFVLVTNLGGGLTRSITLTVTSAVGTNSLVGQVGGAGPIPTGNMFTASFDVASSGTVGIVYAYTSSQNFDPNGFPGSLTFRAAGDNGFGSDIPLTVTINTAAGDLTFNGFLPLTATVTDLDIPFSSFTGTGDLTQVNGVTINMTGGQAADLLIDSIGVRTPDQPTVPAPPAALLALAALPALGAYRAYKRRKAAQA